jgi:branched-chain amino acid transport system ATP-binding protein
MLRLEQVSVAYGKHEALHNVCLEVEAGRTTVILGANGAGKTTLLNTVVGLVRPRPGGCIEFEGRSIIADPPHKIVAAGIVLVPEGRRLFGDMTVIDNLRMGAYTPHARANEARQLEEQLARFPRLAERRKQLARTMSGGEQQMLAIARALMSEPRVLLLDEPSLGLGPALVKDLFATLRTITERGLSVVLVEQNVYQSLRLAHRVYVLENGHIIGSGPAAEMRQNTAIQRAYLGFAEKPAKAAGVAPARYAAGGFVNPFSRTIAAAGPRGQDEDRAMAGLVETMNGGFFHPYARSVSPATSPREITEAGVSDREPASRKEAIPTTGGFVNPQARPAKG